MKKRLTALFITAAVLLSLCCSGVYFSCRMGSNVRVRTPTALSSLQADDTVHKLNVLIQNTPGEAGFVLLNAAALRPEDGVWHLGGNQVVFGIFEGSPMIYRILANPVTQIVSGGDSLLLECQSVLIRKSYDSNFAKNETQKYQPNEWSGSDIDLWLNGDEFYGNPSVFSDAERSAMVFTDLDENTVPVTIGNWTYTDYPSRSRIFLLSADEANKLYPGNPERTKDGASTSWWLRSAFGTNGNGSGSIHGDGHICNNSIQNFGVGVCPAMNIDLSAILFASKIGDSGDALWKLTLLSDGCAITITEEKSPSVTRTDAGTIVTVPYVCTGGSGSKISVIITDKAYADEGARALYRGTLDRISPGSSGGSGAFLLPEELENLTCGIDYHVYIFAEETDNTSPSGAAGPFVEIIFP